MNSLTELNGYSNEFLIPYTDTRNPTVRFTVNSPTTQSQSADEGFSFYPTLATDVIDIVNPSQTNLYYQINISGISGATLTWPTLPSGVTASTPSAGIYRLDGINTIDQWNAVKSPSITLVSNVNGLKTYSSKIGYYDSAEGNTSKVWDTNLLINDIKFFTTPIEFTYQTEQSDLITGVPTLINVDTSYPSATWTVTITPSTTQAISTFTTTGTGGTFNVNSTTKVVTITGTRAQVNSRLSGLTLTSNTTTLDYSLTYYASNNQDANTDSITQIIRSYGLFFLGPVTVPTIYYAEDSEQFVLTGCPVITDDEYTGLGIYTYTLIPNQTNAFRSVTVNDEVITQSYNSSTGVLTLTGTKSSINTALSSIIVRTGIDFQNEFSVTYQVVTPRDDVASKIQLFICNTNDIEITNMAVSRSYIQNNINYLFPSTIPYISDLETDASAQYTISFSSALGLFGFNNDNPVSTLTFTGTKTQCNAKFSTVKFWPNKGVSSNGTFTYIQNKGSVTQVTQTVALTGSAGTFTPITNSITASGTWTPSFAMLRYANQFNVLLVGGGGGGAQGGGGGGGGVLEVTNVPITNQTYNIVVGAGGAIGQHSSNTYGTWNLPGGAGGTTTAFGYSAYGGAGGQNQQTYTEFFAKGGNNGLHSQGGTQYVGSNGKSIYPVLDAGGGGAGAGGNGIEGIYTDPDEDNWTAGSGGPGYLSTITGSRYGGGGGGASPFGPAGVGGSGGGGAGGSGNTPGTNGTNNTGGGGGGGGLSGFSTNISPGLGGSGVVIVKAI